MIYIKYLQKNNEYIWKRLKNLSSSEKLKLKMKYLYEIYRFYLKINL